MKSVYIYFGRESVIYNQPEGTPVPDGAVAFDHVLSEEELDFHFPRQAADTGESAAAETDVKE